MTAIGTAKDGEESRVGGKTLTFLGSSRIFLILQSLEQGVKGQLDLRRDAGSPAQSTLRAHFKNLEVAGAMVKRRRDLFPGVLEYELAEPGRELLVVAAALEQWLEGAPGGQIDLGGDPAKAAIKGLVDGWSSTVLSNLAAGPLSLAQLDNAISVVNYPTIERRLGTLRLAGQIDAAPRTARGTAYEITDWVRQGIGPLVAAARWELHNEQDDVASMTALDVESAFLLVAPLLNAVTMGSSTRRMAVKAQDDKSLPGATGLIELKDGGLAFSSADPGGKITSRVSGSTADWFSALIDGDTRGLFFSGNRDNARDILERLHRTLFRTA